MRFGILLLAYLAAALAGTLGSMVVFTLMGDAPFAYFGTTFPLIFTVGSTLAAPIALPAIIITEVRRISNPAVFASSGLAAGLFISLLLSDGFYPLETALMSVTTSVAALVYWLLAWRIFPLSNKQTNESLND